MKKNKKKQKNKQQLKYDGNVWMIYREIFPWLFYPMKKTNEKKNQCYFVGHFVVYFVLQ